MRNKLLLFFVSSDHTIVSGKISVVRRTFYCFSLFLFFILNLQATGIQIETASRGWVTADIFVWLVVHVLCVCVLIMSVYCVCDMSLYI